MKSVISKWNLVEVSRTRLNYEKRLWRHWQRFWILFETQKEWRHSEIGPNFYMKFEAEALLNRVKPNMTKDDVIAT